MAFPRDLLPSSLFETMEAARRATAPFAEFNRHHDALRAAGVFRFDQSRHTSDYAELGRDPISERLRALGALSGAHAALGLTARDLFPSHVIDQARRFSELSRAFALPSALEPFRTPDYLVMDRILRLSRPELGFTPSFLNAPATVAAFTRASAVADMFEETDRLTRSVREAAGLFSISEMPEFASLASYRTFLDAAGLALNRWPQRRLLTMAEKRRRLKARLQANAAPPHVKTAKTLVHRYELTLREVLDAVMAEAYGEDWARERLPLCDCKDLLKKWEKRGGDVLEHADYAHYARIMSHPEHFEAIFEAGFDDPAAVYELLQAAGALRAASHHARAFTPQDLKDLRLAWKQIEAGLVALTPDFELDW
jgi:hypothetical protein